MGERDEWLEIYDALVNEVRAFSELATALMKIDGVSMYVLDDRYSISSDKTGIVRLSTPHRVNPINVFYGDLREIYENLGDIIEAHKIMLSAIKSKVKRMEDEFNKCMDVLSAIVISRGLKP